MPVPAGLHPRVALDTAVTEAVLGLISAPGVLDTLIPANDERAATARRQLDKLHRRLPVVNDDHADGVYDDNEDEYRRITGDLRARVNECRAMLDELSERHAFTGLSIGTGDIIDQCATVPLPQRRTIVGLLLDITVHPTGPRQVWDPDKHVTITRARRVL